VRILRFLLALLFPSILKWWEGRQQAKALQAQTERADAAARDAVTIRDHAEKESNDAHEQTDASLDAARADAGDPVRVRDDIQSAIDRANSAGD